jgi:hypothetical protein
MLYWFISVRVRFILYVKRLVCIPTRCRWLVCSLCGLASWLGVRDLVINQFLRVFLDMLLPCYMLEVVNGLYQSIQARVESFVGLIRKTLFVMVYREQLCPLTSLRRSSRRYIGICRATCNRVVSLILLVEFLVEVFLLSTACTAVWTKGGDNVGNIPCVHVGCDVRVVGICSCRASSS